MQAKRRLFEVVDRARRFESGENKPDFLDHLRGELAAVVALKQALQPFVFEALDHSSL